MAPSLLPNRLVLATSIYKSLSPQQVVIFRHDRLEMIKRIQKINHGRLFMVGDNPRVSTDSRSFGWVHSDSVIAKVIWPRLY